ncbi:hypothetical protein N0V84_004167 [Fusarium piperis]|uniref:Phosphoinositide phospholipase C n=1 Tax=Fusarium piperis TaxID=1435070 RepID=A0A9W8WG63_9HYPO|nr:hypothetical protein N0V84_004167 [Fusarium piperis]
MLSSVALWALLATTSHAAYVQFRNCYTDVADFRLIPKGLRASLNASGNAFDSKIKLVANYANGTECDATSPLDLVPVFTVLDYNGVHRYPGRIVNTSCAMYGPLEARLRLEIVSAFNRSTFLDTFNVTLDLTTNDGTPLLCANAHLTPEVRPWTQILSFWVPVLVFSAAALIALWPFHSHESTVSSDVQDRNHYRMARAAEILSYIQFIYFSGGLSLQYPGFLQPLVGSSSWSTLMLPAGIISNKSPYIGVRDGIYEMNGTLTSAPGLEILTELTGSPVRSRSWFNTLVLALIVLLFILIKDSAMAVFALVLLLSSFWWTWCQANSEADIGLFVIQGRTRVRGREDRSRKYHALNVFSLMLLRGVIIGGLQAHVHTQFGRQVLTRSTVQGYISALLQGCRSIEVDCWDGRDGQPIVTHGYSLTASISFQDVIDAINQYAFVTSEFPLWISLEVHCSPRQKSIMAQIMRDTFASKLVTEPLSELSTPLPSPSQLRRRILIKTKVAKGVHSDREPQLLKGVPSPRQSQDQGNLTETKSTDSIPSIGSQDTFCQLSPPLPSQNGPLEDLAIYGPGKRLPHPSKIDETGNFIYSVSEANFKSYLKQKHGDNSLGFLNTQHMVRVYPDASRIDSSNLSPLQYWRYGVQMAALNYQTNDHNMRLNQAMFHGGTDNSGYVLKPDGLRQPLELIADHVQELRLTIDVLMTKDLCWPETTSNNASIYIKIKLLVADSHKQDTRQRKGRTMSIPLKRHDVMIDSRLDFQVRTQYPSLVFLQWSVKLSSDNQGYPRNSTIGSGIAKFENLKQGYRLLPLKKSFQDEEDCGYLLCKLDKSLYNQVDAGSEGIRK